MLRISIWIAACGTIGAFGQTTGTVSGTVRAERSQFPISAAITIVSTDSGVRLSSAPADDRGAFSIELPAGRVLLIARADGYVSEQREVIVRPGGAGPTVNFSLTPAASVSGRVVNAVGGGIRDARVWLEYRGAVAGWRLADEAGGQATDAAGSFTVPVVGQGRPFLLHVESEDWLLASSQPMIARSSRLDGVLLVLTSRGATVNGHVRNPGGSPAAGVRVQLRATPPAGGFTAEQRQSTAFSRSMIRFAVTGADGSYSFAGVPAGHIVLTAQTQSQRAAAEAETISDRQTTVELALQ